MDRARWSLVFVGALILPSRAFGAPTRPDPCATATRGRQIEIAYAPLLKWTPAVPEMAADYALARHRRIHAPARGDPFPAMREALYEFARDQERVDPKHLGRLLRADLQAIEARLAREFGASSASVALSIDSYLRPASLMQMALTEKCVPTLADLPLSDAFLGRLRAELNELVPFSLAKFSELYSPLGDFAVALGSETGLSIGTRPGPYDNNLGRAYALSDADRMHFEFRELPWREKSSRGRGAIVYTPATIFRVYTRAMNRIGRARAAIAALPSSDLGRVAQILLDRTGRDLAAELRAFPRVFTIFATLVAAETPGARGEPLPFDRNWLDEFNARITAYAAVPPEQGCARAME